MKFRKCGKHLLIEKIIMFQLNKIESTYSENPFAKIKNSVQSLITYSLSYRDYKIIVKYAYAYLQNFLLSLQLIFVDSIRLPSYIVQKRSLQ